MNKVVIPKKINMACINPTYMIGDNMSSSIDYITCPKCGSTAAYREQDNRTCEVTFGCPNCNWHGETVDKEIKPKKAKKKGLIFTCPECGKHKLGSVEQVIATYPITHIPVNGDLDYDTKKPDISGDIQVLAYQCIDCGYELQDKKGNTITDCFQVPKWIKQHTPKK